MNKQKIITLVFLFVFVTSMFTTFAAAKGGLTVSQMSIILDAEKDEGRAVPVKIANNSSEKMQVTIKKADYRIAEDGAFQVLDPGTSVNSAKDIIACNEEEVWMEPGEEKTVEVSLKTPEEYLYPEYSLAVLIRYAPQKVVESKATVKTYSQVAVTVRVLSGKRLKNDIDTSVAPLSVNKLGSARIMKFGGMKKIPLTLLNKGVLTIEPKISASVSSLFSDEVEEIQQFKGFVSPGQQRTYSIVSKSNSIFDFYTMTVNMEYEYSGKQFSVTSRFTYVTVSYQLVIGVVLVAAGIAVQIILYRRKNKMIKKLLEEKKKQDV